MKFKKPMAFHRLLTALFLGLFLLLPGPSGDVQFSNTAQAGFFNSDLEIFEEVVGLVADHYVYAPNYKKIFSGAIEEMTRSVKADGLISDASASGTLLEKGDSSIRYRVSFSRSENMHAMRSVYQFLLKNFRETTSRDQLETAGIAGLMNALDDYSVYMDPTNFERSMRDTEGQYGGVGMVITLQDDRLTIIKILKNSPSSRAGILPKDIITQVDGQELKGLGIQELADKLRGHPETIVILKVLRPATGISQLYTLEREIISVEAVEYKNLDDAVAHIRITSFSKQTNDQLEEALAQAEQDHVNKFILDLRDNPGGLLTQSVKVASHFLARGDLIVTTRGRNPKDVQSYEALYRDNLKDRPVVVLINGHSASASEIVSGSLKDAGNALILGTNSYGKGSVQTIFRMSDGSGLRLTTSKYYTPSGIDITLHGIVPEIQLEPDLTEGRGEIPGLKKHRGAALPDGSIRIKESELKKFLEKQKVKTGEDADLWVSFAKMVLMNSKHTTKSHALAKARELVKAMHY